MPNSRISLYTSFFPFLSMTKQHFLSIVPDHTVIVDGVLLKNILDGKLDCSEIIIHEALLSYLESQARMGTAQGNIGIDELEKIAQHAKDGKFTLRYAGKRLFSRDSEDVLLVDQAIRDLALETRSILVTSKRLQSKIASTQGIQVHFIERVKTGKILGIETFFDQTTMSVHLREKVCPMRKCGRPGDWAFITVRETPLTAEEIKEYSREIIEETSARDDGFIEIERPGSTIVQLGNYRIVITRPPFSD